MSEQAFREIELNRKQVVFVFMAAVVLAVVIFLLGLKVGRGVRVALGEATVADTGQPTDTVVGTTPAAAPTTPPELSYYELLQAQGGQPPAPPGGQPAGADPAKAAAPPPAPSGPPPTPVETVQTAPAPGARAQPPAGGFDVQVGAFSARPAADKLVATLIDKGYPAFLYTPEQSPGPRFRVRVGPYAERSAADRVAGRLKQEGFSPLVQPR